MRIKYCKRQDYVKKEAATLIFVAAVQIDLFLLIVAPIHGRSKLACVIAAHESDKQ